MIAVMTGPAPSVAQTTSAQVTLTVPVDLTNLGPDITKVRVGCSIGSNAITNGNANREIIQTQEIPASGGVVKTQASLVFNFTQLNNPVGQTANVVCSLMGWSQSQQKWDQFTGAHPDPSFRTNATISLITTAFVW